MFTLVAFHHSGLLIGTIDILTLIYTLNLIVAFNIDDIVLGSVGYI